MMEFDIKIVYFIVIGECLVQDREALVVNCRLWV